MSARPLRHEVEAEQGALVEALTGGDLRPIQDELFGALFENARTGDALEMARSFDDQETAAESLVDELILEASIKLLAGAPKADVVALLSRALLERRRAELLDDAERQAHERAEQHRQRDGDAVRIVSSQVELARLKAAGGRR